LRALLLIAQYFIRLRRFLEFILRSFITGVAVRVVLHRHLPISFFDLIGRGAFGNAQNLVKISFRPN
jgi:hypothetical protein